MRPLALALAFAADLAIGDPHRLPHPVRGIGWVAGRIERVARRHTQNQAMRELVAGAAGWLAIAGGTYLATSGLLYGLTELDTRLALIARIMLGCTTVATRDLVSEARAVERALRSGDIELARHRVARIVGRDTQSLDASEIARATVETLAESTCDGIIAPLLALAAGDVPLAMAFKAMNTLDSMWGHREAPYTHFGRAAARADDVACFLAARATVAGIALCAPLFGDNGARAMTLARREGGKHRSPNAGLCEAAMAGALGIRLGGTNVYDGMPIEGPRFNAGARAPEARDIARAERIVVAVAFTGLVAALGLTSTTRKRA